MRDACTPKLSGLAAELFQRESYTYVRIDLTRATDLQLIEEVFRPAAERTAGTRIGDIVSRVLQRVGVTEYRCLLTVARGVAAIRVGWHPEASAAKQCIRAGRILARLSRPVLVHVVSVNSDWYALCGFALILPKPIDANGFVVF